MDDIDEFAGYVAAEGNHCKDPTVRRALDAVYDRLAKLATAQTDQEPVTPCQAKLGRCGFEFPGRICQI